MKGRAHYDAKAIRDLLRHPENVERVVRHLYGEEAQSDGGQFLLAGLAGGIGNSCRIDATGRDAGKFRDVNPEARRPHGDLVDAVEAVRGCSTREAIRWLGDLLEAPSALSVVDGGRDTGGSGAEEVTPLSDETRRRMVARLEATPAALEYLHGLGLADETREHFRIGVEGGAGPGKADRRPHEAPATPVLAFPVLARNGTPIRRLMKAAIPDLTPRTPAERWSAGAAQTTWCGPATGKLWLAVVDDPQDQWAIWQAIQGTSLAARLAVITSSRPGIVPDEWRNASFWAPWDRVFFAHGHDEAGERAATALRQDLKREVHRLEPPHALSRGWIDLLSEQNPWEILSNLCASAPAFGAPRPSAAASRPLEHQADGVYRDGRINVNGAFHNGMMYYPFRVRRVETVARRRKLPDGSAVRAEEKVTRYATQVVRSDGVVLGLQEAPSPAGTPDEDKVFLLDDGTEVVSVPKPEEFATWKWEEINAFVEKRDAGKPVCRPLGEIVADVEAHLRELTWLPYEDDYALIALYIVMSYVYNAFDAIPLLLLNGEKGAGKSTLAEAVAAMSFNGCMLGNASERAIIRASDQGRGLVVLDDLESVGRRGQEDFGFGDINQVIKVSYAKATGIKSVVEKNGISRRLYFYGPKVITNISGIDPVNGSRMFTIVCRPMPDGVRAAGTIRGRDPSVSAALRSELHAWGMASIADAHSAWKRRTASLGDRAAQIAAPLLALADLAGSEPLARAIQRCLDRQSRRSVDTSGPEDLLRLAVAEAIRRGARSELSMAQLRNELALIPETAFLEPKHNVPTDLLALQDPRRVGAMLRNIGARGETEPGRQRLFGQLVRTYRLDPDFIARIERELAARGIEPETPPEPIDPKRRALAFCERTTCGKCPYAHVCGSANPGLQGARASAQPT
jgi:hypothetical protein